MWRSSEALKKPWLRAKLVSALANEFSTNLQMTSYRLIYLCDLIIVLVNERFRFTSPPRESQTKNVWRNTDRSINTCHVSCLGFLWVTEFISKICSKAQDMLNSMHQALFMENRKCWYGYVVSKHKVNKWMEIRILLFTNLKEKKRSFLLQSNHDKIRTMSKLPGNSTKKRTVSLPMKVLLIFWYS